MAADITIVIPNWNGAERLRRLLVSLGAQTVAATRVLVVDNGSQDDSLEVASSFGAEVLGLPSNHGFAVAVNRGIEASSTTWLAIVNNDVELEPSWLERLLSAASDSGAWFATGRILDWNDPSRLDGCFDLLSRSGLAWRAGHGQPAADYSKPRRVAMASFTALVLRRDLFSDVGLLDERFESYLEDVDFGLRCAIAGLTGIYEPSATCRHEGSATLGQWSPRTVELISRNQVLLVAKHFPDGWRSSLGWAVVAGQALWGALAIREGHAAAWVRGKLLAFREWRAWRETRSTHSPGALNAVLIDQEREIQVLQKQGSRDALWRWYFRLAGRTG